MLKITNINDIQISDFISLKDKPLRDDKLIVIESDKVIKRVLPIGITIYKIFCTQNYYDKNADFLNKHLHNNNNLFVAIPEIMKQIVGYRVHQGIMALTDRPEDLPLQKLKPPFLIINGITGQENMGTIIRNCRAFGINSIIVDKLSVTPWHKRCVRVSLGNIFKINIHHSENLIFTIEYLKKNNITIYGTTVNNSTVNINDCKFKKDIAIILGSEGYGVYPQIRKLCDHMIKIPLQNEVSSINVACASGIILNKLYEKLSINNVI